VIACLSRRAVSQMLKYLANHVTARSEVGRVSTSTERERPLRTEEQLSHVRYASVA
jgi:hypothetical protein